MKTVLVVILAMSGVACGKKSTTPPSTPSTETVSFCQSLERGYFMDMNRFAIQFDEGCTVAYYRHCDNEYRVSNLSDNGTFDLIVTNTNTSPETSGACMAPGSSTCVLAETSPDNYSLNCSNGVSINNLTHYQ